MKRSLIVLSVVVIGAALYSETALRHAQLLGELNEAEASRVQAMEHADTVTQSNERARARLQFVKGQVRSKRGEAPVSESARRLNQLDRATGNGSSIAEGTLDALGISWESSKEYVLVPKEVLPNLKVKGLDEALQLSDSAASVLNLNREQEAAVQHALSEAGAAYLDWKKSAAQRTPMQDPQIVQWTIPANPELRTTLTGYLNHTLDEAIGSERSRVVQQFWKEEVESAYGGFGEVEASVTISWKSGSKQPLLSFKEDYGTTDQITKTSFGYITPDPNFRVIETAPMPRMFRSLFPGGWAELLAREGIALPAEK